MHQRETHTQLKPVKLFSRRLLSTPPLKTTFKKNIGEGEMTEQWRSQGAVAVAAGLGEISPGFGTTLDNYYFMLLSNVLDEKFCQELSLSKLNLRTLPCVFGVKTTGKFLVVLKERRERGMGKCLENSNSSLTTRKSNWCKYYIIYFFYIHFLLYITFLLYYQASKFTRLKWKDRYSKLLR